MNWSFAILGGEGQDQGQGRLVVGKDDTQDWMEMQDSRIRKFVPKDPCNQIFSFLLMQILETGLLYHPKGFPVLLVSSSYRGNM